MLPAAARLRHRQDFAEVVRRGRRTARGPLVLHALAAPAPAAARGSAHVSRETTPAALRLPPESGPGFPPPPFRLRSPQVGFVIGKAVGPAVVRNRLRRRLRALLSARLGDIPAGARLVVRAQPGAGALSSGELAGLLDAALPRIVTS